MDPGHHPADVALRARDRIKARGTGAKIASSPPPLALTIQPVTFQATQKKNAGAGARKGVVIGIVGPAGRSVVVEYTTDRVKWNTLATVGNPNGTTGFADNSTNLCRFYRAKLQ